MGWILGIERFRKRWKIGLKFWWFPWLRRRPLTSQENGSGGGFSPIAAVSSFLTAKVLTHISAISWSWSYWLPSQNRQLVIERCKNAWIVFQTQTQLMRSPHDRRSVMMQTLAREKTIGLDVTRIWDPLSWRMTMRFFTACRLVWPFSPTTPQAAIARGRREAHL